MELFSRTDAIQRIPRALRKAREECHVVEAVSTSWNPHFRELKHGLRGPALSHFGVSEAEHAARGSARMI